MANVKTADKVRHYEHNQPLGNIAIPHSMRVLTVEIQKLVTVFHEVSVTFSYLKFIQGTLDI